MRPDALGLVADAQAALRRMAVLFGVADEEHTHAELLATLSGVRHEHQTAVAALGRLTDVRVPENPVSSPSGRSGPSGMALRALSTRPESGRHVVLQAIADAPDGLTDLELAHDHHLNVASVRARRGELAAAGYIQRATVALTTDGPDRVAVGRKTWSRRHCSVWEVTAAGRKALAKLASGQMVLALIDP